MKETLKLWKKVLYENQGYPDNYTDTTFLRDLRKNIDVKEVKLSQAVVGTSVLIQEICVVIIFTLTYVYLYNGWFDPHTVLYKSSVIAALGFIFYRVFYTSENLRTVLSQDVRTVLIFLIFGQLFSPVLHTLTDTISTDTIYTMAFLMMIIHLIFSDYAVPAAIVSNCLALSAAIFGSVCLASRLPSAYHAFVLLTVAIECFVLFPFLRVKVCNVLSFTIIFVLLIIYILSSVSLMLTVLFVSMIVLISVICPFLFVKYQKYKDNIYGPWDEAVINDADNINELIL